jgi:hypothetical protein
MSAAGNWKINPWVGGYPIWCELFYRGERLTQVRHTELRDLEYAVKRAINEARSNLPDNYKHEMD